MKLITALVTFLLATFAVIVNAQVTYNNVTGAFSCSPGGGAYCAGDSLTTNIIIRCNDKVGQPGNCNDNLAGVPPVGVKTFAPCYETSLTAGDAACSWNCTAYPDTGNEFTLPSSVTSKCFVPGAASPNPSTGSSSPISNGTTASSSSTSAEIIPMTSIVSGYGAPSAPTAPPATTSTSINVPAAISAMTAGGISMYSVASGSSETAFPSSLSSLGPLFSSLIANAGNATVSALSVPTEAASPIANTNAGTTATAAPTATAGETVSTITSTSGSSTVTMTTTLSATYLLPSPTGEGTGPLPNGSQTAVASPAFTGGASANANVKASFLVALVAIPAMLLY